MASIPELHDLKLWADPNAFQINRLPMRTPFVSTSSIRVSLNGDWRIKRFRIPKIFPFANWVKCAMTVTGRVSPYRATGHSLILGTSRTTQILQCLGAKRLHIFRKKFPLRCIGGISRLRVFGLTVELSCMLVQRRACTQFASTENLLAMEPIAV